MQEHVSKFEAFPKIPRLNKGVIITEKLDGTNASILIEGDKLYTFSRNREITVEDDNYSFSAWAHFNHASLKEVLGEGRHFGEWYGVGINRNYGLFSRRFALFNTKRYAELGEELAKVGGLECVTVLNTLPTFDTHEIAVVLGALKREGSRHVPGYPRPEGVVVHYPAGNHLYKVLCENDDMPKSLVGS